jgi:metal-responsive CopG/Arc/MetJ family transcriptional regulator
MAKVQISIDDSLLARVDGYASDNYLSRSGLISLACVQFLNSAEAVVAVKDMSVSLRKIADSGDVDEETMKQLEGFERLSKMLIGK